VAATHPYFHGFGVALQEEGPWVTYRQLCE
jgi:hypothetical protein